MGTDKKGAVGVASALRDLTLRGFYVSLPVSEHSPFDLVASRGGLHRSVQVRYRAVDKQGVLAVPFDGSWANTKGSHKRRLNKVLVDIICVYCPDTDACYYLNPSDFGVSATLRVSDDKRPTKNARMAADYTTVPCFEEAAPLPSVTRTTRKSGKKSTLAPRQCAHCRSWFKPRAARVIHCSTVCSGYSSRRAARPSKRELHKLTRQYPLSHLATQYGVSGTTIAEWCKSLGVEIPPVGYWQKKRSKDRRPTMASLKRLVWEMPMYKVAKKLAVSPKQVRRWCKELGIRVPPTGHWLKASPDV